MSNANRILVNFFLILQVCCRVLKCQIFCEDRILVGFFVLRKKRVIHDKTKSRQNSVNHVSWRYMVKENAPFQIILQSCLFTDQKLAQLQKNLHLLHILLQSCALSSQNFARIIKNCTFSRFFSKAARSLPKILRG